jgi:photosystem II stability/assembly factor-like uncharacterized protein
MRVVLLNALLAVSVAAVAQHAFPTPASAVDVWQMQDSGTTASLRGIDAVSSAVAWASGTAGTVLRTTDGGAHWQQCAVPAASTDGATLDFRGVQAFDDTTAFAMSSGPGLKSRLYKTTDGCKSWKLVLENTDPNGFWDGVVFQRGDYGLPSQTDDGALIGDPLYGRFDTRLTFNRDSWFIDTAGCAARPGESAFAASNSSFASVGFGRYILGTGGKSGAHVLLSPLLSGQDGTGPCSEVEVPMAGGNESSGIFSLAFRDVKHGVAVGGDYTKPNETKGTAAITDGGWKHWTASAKPPHGYRSSVKWSAELNAWITAGTNGSDMSRDDGKTWGSLDDGNWNALSLPFVVGPNGRIGRLNPAALAPGK